MNNATRSTSRAAFTLLELLAVLTLIVIFSAIVIVSLQGPIRRAQLQTTVDHIIHTDQRQRAKSSRSRLGRRIVIDLSAQAIHVIEDDTRTITARWQVPEPIQIVELNVAGRRLVQGITEIEIDEYGHSPTYAIHIKGTGEDDTWLLFAGMSGQASRFQDTDHVKKVIQDVFKAGSNPS